MKRTSSERVLRMLSIIPWVASHPGGVAIDELCTRFGIDRKALIADLETASMVGLAPFTPDVLIEVIIDEDRVMVTLPQAFRRPLRLNSEQGLALLARTQGLLAVPGVDPDGPLSRGLSKLASAIGVELDTTLGIELGRAEPEILEVLDTAIRSGRRLEFDYYSYGRDAHTHRTVDPYGINSHRGQWYLTAFCHLSDEDRTFRLDRMSNLVMTDESADGARAALRGSAYRPAAGDPSVEMTLSPGARWVVEQYPCEEVTELADGRLCVRMRISSLGHLERLLLRLGPACESFTGPDELLDAGRAAARRVLARYPVD